MLRRDWTAVASSVGYQRLKQREISLGRAFDERAFRMFVESEELTRQADAERWTIDAWVHADLSGAARRALAYLPVDAFIRATVYPVIKPQRNSFVFEASTNPAIFLFVDPEKSAAEIENTIAHEMHHIGSASLGAKYETSLTPLSAEAQAVGRWLTAFGEGIAMLAAAGGPDVHPHGSSSAADRARWDRDVANFSVDLATVDRFFLDVLARQITGEEIQRQGMSFFGVQGPWYTVGWKMAVVVEQTYGRGAVIQAVADPRRLLTTYNRAVQERRLDLPLWSNRVTSISLR